MGASTPIQWTDATWAPARGCSRISPGCENCYAEGVAARFSGPGLAFDGFAKFSDKRRLPQWTGKVELQPEHILDPLRWRRPRKVFVSSMTDVFHEELSNEEIAAVFGVMAASPRHTFQILTKRAKRMREWFEWSERGRHAFDWVLEHPTTCGAFDNRHPWRWPLPNVHLLVSVENQATANERIPEILQTPAAVRGVSYEPALELVDFRRIATTRVAPGHVVINALTGRIEMSPWIMDKLDWVVIGGESGPRARPFDVAWARSVVQQCKAAGVAVFCKQLGAQAFDETACATCRRPFESSDHVGSAATHRFVDCYDAGVPVPRLDLKSRKGGDMAEWPTDLRVREFPEVRP